MMDKKTEALARTNPGLRPEGQPDRAPGCGPATEPAATTRKETGVRLPNQSGR